MSEERPAEPKRETSHAARFTALSVVGHAIFAFGFLIFLFFMMPSYRRLFKRFNADLNIFTMTILDLGDIAQRYATPLMLFTVLLLAIDAVIHFALYRTSARWSHVWGWTISILFAVLFGATFFTLQLSIAALQ